MAWLRFRYVGGHIEHTLQKYVKLKDKATLGQDWDEVFKTGDSRHDKR